MALTVQQVLVAAAAKSTKANLTQLTASEGVRIVHRALLGLFMFAARVQPFHFAKRAEVPQADGAWAWPADVESIVAIELADGSEVAEVPEDDRRAEESMPSVYRLGRAFYPANLIDDGPPLVLLYASRPAKPAVPADVIDPRWEDDYAELLELEVAIYMALKDGRADDVEQLKIDRGRWAQMFSNYLEHSTTTLRRRYGAMRAFNVQTGTPATALLAGGAE